MKTVIIGLGNPILSDDSVGIKASRLLKQKLQDCDGIDVIELYAGGLRLMDALMGYERAIIIDATQYGNCTPGTIRCEPLSSSGSTRNIACSHDTSLLLALEMGSLLGYSLPGDIRIWGIEAKDIKTFGEDLTEDVQHAVPKVVDQVMHELRSSGTIPVLACASRGTGGALEKGTVS